MKTIYRDIVSALIFSSDGKLFMGMKDPSKGGVYADCWHIPGGGVDEGEAKHEALERELKEEVGLEIDPKNFKLIDDVGEGESIKTVNGEDVLCKMKFYVYRIDLAVKADKADIKLNDDLVKYEWVELEKLSKYKLTPPSMRLFKKLKYI